MKLEKLIKWSLLATFFINMAASFVFVSVFGNLRETGGLAERGNSFYEWILALWVFFFGAAYLWLAFRERGGRSAF